MLIAAFFVSSDMWRTPSKPVDLLSVSLIPISFRIDNLLPRGNVTESNPSDQMTPSFFQPLIPEIKPSHTKDEGLRGASRTKGTSIAGTNMIWKIPPKISTGASSFLAKILTTSGTSMIANIKSVKCQRSATYSS